MALLSFLFDWSGRSGRPVFAYVALAFLAAGAWLIWATVSGSVSSTAPGVRWPLLAVGALVLPFHAVLVRRLHDSGTSAALYWASLVPALGLLALWIVGRAPPVRSYEPLPSLARRLAVLITSSVALGMCLSAFLTVHRVTSNDMKPALVPGDVVLVSRWASGGPAPGDIAVFLHPTTRAPLARRVIGVSGARVELQGGRVAVDGEAVPQVPAGQHTEVYSASGPEGAIPFCANAPVGEGGTCAKNRLQETLPNGQTYIVLKTRDGPLDQMASTLVPDGYVFVMGDNRDNATDSRVSARANGVGMVPVSDVLGRSGRILMSSSGRTALAVWEWRWDRFGAVVE